MTPGAIRVFLFLVVCFSSLVATPAAAQSDSEESIARSAELVFSGGGGFYNRQGATRFQPTANIDIFGRADLLILAAGLHVGVSPLTEALSLGFRLPISEQDRSHGMYADLGLLFFDNGQDSDAFQTGLRVGIVGRSNSWEYRAVGELRRIPLDGGRTELWGGLELGYAIGISGSSSREGSRKDTLRAELKHIATSGELDDLQQTTSDAEIETFLTRFWEAHRPDTLSNDFRREYEHRVQLANERYSTQNVLGATTDMGRVLILYGEADRSETAYSTARTDQKYELWIYTGRIKGHQTALFLFLARTGGGFDMHSGGRGGFKQIYSNVPGENSEGIPLDLPPAMFSYVSNFGR